MVHISCSASKPGFLLMYTLMNLLKKTRKQWVDCMQSDVGAFGVPAGEGLESDGVKLDA